MLLVQTVHRVTKAVVEKSRARFTSMRKLDQVKEKQAQLHQEQYGQGAESSRIGTISIGKVALLRHYALLESAWK